MGRKSKVDERKLEIIGHLYSLIKEEGLESASISRIADRMGVNPSLIIHYFHTKDDLMVELVGFILTRYEDTFLTELDRIKQPEDRLEFVLDIVFSPDWLSVSDPEVFYACYYMSQHNPRVKKHFQDMYDWFKDLLINEIESWIEHGLISPNNPAQIAEFIITLNEGTTYLWGVWKDKEQYAQRGVFLKSLVMSTLQSLKIKTYI